MEFGDCIERSGSHFHWATLYMPPGLDHDYGGGALTHHTHLSLGPVRPADRHQGQGPGQLS